MIRRLDRVLGVALALFAASAEASIVGGNTLSIDFTDSSDATAKATWSTPDRLTISEEGLGWNGDSASRRAGWVQTKPLAVGLCWRPASSVTVRVDVRPSPAKITLHNGQETVPYGGDVYIRYSPDRENWSTWQVMQRQERPEADEPTQHGTRYRITLKAPRAEREEYSERIQEYATLDVPWKSDEEAAVRWILESDPDFFSRRLPFIGYVEFRYEADFYGSQRLKSLRAHVGYGVSGLHYNAKEGEVPPTVDSPWRFRADEAPGRD